MDRSEPPTKKRRTETPVKEGPKEKDPIPFKEEEHVPIKDDETGMKELSLLLTKINNLTRRNNELRRVLDETLAETTKLRIHLNYIQVVRCIKAENPMFRLTSILISPRKRPPVRKTKSPKKRAN